VLLGASRLGEPGQPETDELAEAMLLAGFPAVDTSNRYASGHSEEALGRAIARVGLPEGTVVTTKVDADTRTGVFDGDRVRRSFEESLARLGLDRLPLLQIHDPYTISFAQAMSPRGAVAAMVRLREEGTVDAIGITGEPVGLLLDYIGTGAFDAVLTHSHYNLIDRGSLVVLQAARDRGMLTINAAPFGGGILAGSSSHQDSYAYRPASPDTLRRVAEVERICARYDVPMDTAALAFSTRADLVDATAVGVSSPARLRRLHEIARADVPTALLAELETVPDRATRDD
jgi:D-threo-aldose 1-dehydrogenase